MLQSIIKGIVRRIMSNINASISATNHRVDVVEAKANSTDAKLTAIMDGYPQNAENLGRCIATMGQELGSLNTRYDQLYQELQALKATVNPAPVPSPAPAPTPSTNLDLGYYANVLFLCPMEDRYSLPLKGTIENCPYDYRLECDGIDGLTVVQALPTLNFGTQPSFINLEVRGEGTLVVTIRQTILVDGAYNGIMIKEFCRLAIHRGVSEYRVEFISSNPIQMLLDVTRMNRPMIDPNS